MPELYADLAIPNSSSKLFTYLVPHGLRASIRCGVRAVAPFGTRTVVGIVVALGEIPGALAASRRTEAGETSPGVTRFRPIHEILDAEPVLTDDLLKLARWMAEYYYAPLGDVIKSVLTVNAGKAGIRFAELSTSGEEAVSQEKVRGDLQRSILKEISERGRIPVSRLRTMLGGKRISQSLNALAASGHIRIVEEPPRAGFKARTEAMIPVDEAWRARWARWMSGNGGPGARRRSAHQRAVISELLSAGTAQTAVPAREIFLKTGATHSTLKTLTRQGILAVEHREQARGNGYDLYAASLGAQNIVLNPRQRRAVDSITSAAEKEEFRTFLLFGVTGSGKTQVYIEAIRSILARGKTAIVLVPEISLTPQIVRRFKHQLGDLVAVQHSRMTARERWEVWRDARQGKVSVVIGPRSSVFAPLKNVGLIVVDEEQESSYKQYDQSPHYNARDVAVVRGSIAKAVVVLGSATPSLESYSNAERGKYEMLELPERVDDAQLPEIRIVDMAEERKARYAAHRAARRADFQKDPIRARAEPRKFQMSSLSEILKEKIADRLHKREGIIILQNRRGFSPFIECYECGHVEMCPNCSISLTYHAEGKDLRCHYCGLIRRPPERCPECQSTDLEYRGFGTQRVEEEIRAQFPGASLERMDRDTTAGKDSHDNILRRFSEGDADILLGTQMVAKGLDVSRVTLVGVISADTQMLLPDFRSSEHTYQLLAQVAGRAGRSKLPGEVIIQSYLPRHETLAQVVTHDYKAFYEREAGFRRRLAYPPYSRLVLIEFRGEKETEVFRRASRFAASVRGGNGDMVALGPATAPIARLKGLFRCHVLLKDLKKSDASGHAFRAALERALLDYRTSARGEGNSVKITVDVDPVGMM